MLVDAAKHLGLPIMHRKPCNRAFSQGKHVAPLLDYARINELVLPLSALSANQNGLATLHAVQGRGELMHYQYVVPRVVQTADF
jgi:hypothetical protein